MTYPIQTKTLLIGKEELWGTAVSPTKDIGLIVTEVADPFTRVVNESMSIGDREAQKITSGLVDVGLNVTGEFQHGRVLTYVFGTAAHSDLTGGDVSHTFTVTDPKSLTIESSENSSTDTVLTHNGMLVETAEFTIELDGKLLLNLELKGKSTTSSDSASAHVISSLPVYPHALVTVKLNGTAATEVQNASIKFTSEIQRSGGIGSNLYQQGHPTAFKAEWSATLGFQNKTYQELGLGGTTPSATSDPTAFDFEINPSNGVAAGSGKRGMDLALENCIVNDMSVDATVGELIFITLSGIGTLKQCITYDNIGTAAWQ